MSSIIKFTKYIVNALIKDAPFTKVRLVLSQTFFYITTILHHFLTERRNMSLSVKILCLDFHVWT